MSTTYSLSGREAGSIATRGRQLLRRGLITHAQHSLLDTVLWAARRPGSATLIASLHTLARLAGQARSTVAQGVSALERLGLLQRIRRRIRTTWIGGGQASRQVANLYRLMPPDTGSDHRPAREQALIISVVEVPIGVARTAQEALARRRRTFEARLLGRVRAV